MERREPPDLDHIFAALADPTRRAILTMLLAGDQSVGTLATPHAMSLAAISKHLQILARAGLIAQNRSGRTVDCRLLPEGLRAAGIWLQGVGGFDAEDYDALERLLSLSLQTPVAGPDDEEELDAPRVTYPRPMPCPVSIRRSWRAASRRAVPVRRR